MIQKKTKYLINRPMFNPDFLKVGTAIQVTKDKEKRDCMIREVAPLKITLSYFTADGSITNLEVSSEEVWNDIVRFNFFNK